MRVRIKKAPERSDDRWRMTDDSGLPQAQWGGRMPTNDSLQAPGYYGPDAPLSAERLQQLQRQQGLLRADMRNWVTNPMAFMPPVPVLPAMSRKPIATEKPSKTLSLRQQQLKLAPDFNKHSVSWLKQYGYEPTEEGYAKALRDVGYDGNTDDIRGLQKHLINLNLLNENSQLFQDQLKKYGMTRQGIEKGYDENWEDFGYEPEMNSAGWVKDMLENSYADNILGKRTDEMLEGLLKKPPKLQGASVVDYLNSQGIDSSKENRKKLAQSMGINDYNYTAADNLRLLEYLKSQKKQMGGERGNGEWRMGNGGWGGKQGNGEWRMGNGGWRDNSHPEASGSIFNSQFSRGNGFFQEGGAVGMNQMLRPVERGDANIEAERGETVMGDFDDDGMQEHLPVGGRRHSEGGTPLSVPDGSFVFSDTRKLKIGGPMLAEFGKSATTKKKFTPAELAKQYDLNRYKDIIQDPDADPMDRKTAALMLQNYQQKLGKLALYQEAMKGFPQGIPGIAMPLVQGMMGGQRTDDRGQMTDDGGMPMAQWGGSMVPGSIQTDWRAPFRLNTGTVPGSVQDDWRAPLMLAANAAAPDGQGGVPPWFKLWTKSNTPGGSISPTGRSTVYDPSQGNGIYDDYKYWSQVAGRPFQNAKDYQSFVYNKVKNADPNSAMKMWGDYGLTKAGIANGDDANWGFDDGIFGARTAGLSHWRPRPAPGPVPVPGTVPQVPAATVSKPGPEPGTYKGGTSINNNRMPWWPQDKFNTAGSLQDLYDLKKYGPTYVGMNSTTPDTVFYDPTRALATVQESMAMQNMGNVQFAGPQGLRGRMSNVSGQGFGQVANTLPRYEEQNVTTANTAAARNAEIKNTENLQNRSALSRYVDQNTIADQQWENAKRTLTGAARAQVVNGMTNAMRTNWVNRLNPYYNIDLEGKKDQPAGSLVFTSGKGINGEVAAGLGAGADPLSLYNTYYDKFMATRGADQKTAREFAIRMAFGNKSRYGVDSDGDASMSMSGYSPNAQAQAMLNMYGR